MSIPRPTLAKINGRGQSEVEAKLPGAEARLYATPESVLVEVDAGHHHALYGRVERAERNLFPHLVEDRFVDEMLQLWKVSNGAGGFGRIGPTKATGRIVVTGESPATVPTGREWQIGDQVYTIDVGYTFVETLEEHEFAVTAKTAGPEANTKASGTPIALVSPIALVVSPAFVMAGGIDGGADQETLAAARIRLREQIRAPNAGGARNDWIPIAKAASTLVTEAWEQPRVLGSGTMRVLIANDNENPPLADATLVAIVQTYMRDTDSDSYVTGKAPTSAIVTVASVTAKAFAVTASIELDEGAIWEDENGDGVKRDIGVELAALVAEVRKPAVTITLEEIGGAIQAAAGVLTHNLTSPATDVTHTALEIPYIAAHTLTEA